MEKTEEIMKEMKKTSKELMTKSIDTIDDLLNELKYAEDDKYDEIKTLIKQGLHTIKWMISTY